MERSAVSLATGSALVCLLGGATWVHSPSQSNSPLLRGKTRVLATGTAVLPAREGTQGTAVKAKEPSLDYPPPPPAASLAWPKYLSWLAATIAAVQGIRRKLFGGSEAVALDPALPWAVRMELINSRRDLRSRAQGAPRAFRKMLRDSADTLEEVPALLVTVAVLAGDALRKPGNSLKPFRRLGEAQALLFTAGRLHLEMKGEGSTMRLLGGDFLYAEGQWMLAELGSLPVIRHTARMIRDISDGSAPGGAAGDATAGQGGVADLGAQQALHIAFLRSGTYFATVAGGAAWMSGAPAETVDALQRYGSDLGCALWLAQFRDLKSQDCALWLARSAGQALEGLPGTLSNAAVRGMRRLAHRVERSCARSLGQMLRGSSSSTARGLSFADFEQMRVALGALFRRPEEANDEGEDAADATSMGFRRDQVSERELNWLIANGLSQEPLSQKVPPAPPWPEGGPKAAIEGALRCVGRELVGVNKMLDGSDLSQPATSLLVKDEVLRLFRSGGKRLRPALVLLVARALEAPESALRRVASLAASVEVLHSASLVHDDILDGAALRRGEETAHIRLGERSATLVGDFLFGTASCLVAELGSLPTVLLISKVVADFGRGELAQSAVRFEAVRYSLEDYLAKSFYKTASLLAAACQAAAVLCGARPSSKEALSCYKFGAYVGLAFQVVDDILDFTSSNDVLGKPALADLAEGNLSAPILFAVQQSALESESRADLLAALERRLSQEGDLDKVVALVNKGGGVERAKELARRFVDLGVLELEVLRPSEAKNAMRIFAEFVLARRS